VAARREAGVGDIIGFISFIGFLAPAPSDS
jgi:hypothetical protein